MCWWGIMSRSSSRCSPPHHGFVTGYIAMKIVLSLLRRRSITARCVNSRAAQPPPQIGGYGPLGGIPGRAEDVVSSSWRCWRRLRRDTQHPRSRHGWIRRPLWVKISGALASRWARWPGGGRIMPPPRRKIIDLDPARGAAGPCPPRSASLCSYIRPTSATQGRVGGNHGRGCLPTLTVRWGVAGDIVITWFLCRPPRWCRASLYLVVALPLGVH